MLLLCFMYFVVGETSAHSLNVLGEIFASQSLFFRVVRERAVDTLLALSMRKLLASTELILPRVNDDDQLLF